MRALLDLEHFPTHRKPLSLAKKMFSINHLRVFYGIRRQALRALDGKATRRPLLRIIAPAQGRQSRA
jgi:hypothetical protein